jgi:hypothetical protein
MYTLETEEMTPEGATKAKIDKVLKNYPGDVYYHKPVMNGMGVPTLDYVGCACGKFFAIEAKAPGKKPTARQEITMADMRAAGAKVFFCDGDTTELEQWLDKCWPDKY